MAIDNDVKEVLDEHKEILDKHSELIQSLQIDNAETKQRIKNIENSNQEIKEDIKEIKTVLYQSQNSNSNNTALLGQLLLKMTDANTQKDTNDTQEKVAKNTNMTNIIIQIIIGISTIAGAIYAVSPK